MVFGILKMFVKYVQDAINQSRSLNLTFKTTGKVSHCSAMTAKGFTLSIFNVAIVDKMLCATCVVKVRALPTWQTTGCLCPLCTVCWTDRIGWPLLSHTCMQFNNYLRLVIWFGYSNHFERWRHLHDCSDLSVAKWNWRICVIIPLVWSHWVVRLKRRIKAAVKPQDWAYMK